MAKRKMNTFLLQFKTSIYFWRNYYSRSYNPQFGEPQDIDEGRSLELDQEVIDAARLRGLVLHRVGHGWTAESIGFHGLGWYQADREPDDSTRELLAQVDGKRELFGNTPINTELCYSNRKAFDGMVNEIIAYAQGHAEVDCLHFWLSDATNNFCECDSCTAVSPSDWYAKLINEVGRRLDEMGLATRLVFLCYTNTLTPPVSVELDDGSGRLIYMFAPISRCYSHPLADPSCSGIGQAGGWALNKVKGPRTNAEFVEIRRAWGKAFGGDSFVFDYYLWQPYHRCLNPLGFARLMNADVRDLKALNLNGLVSCQVLRSFYPSGLVMAVMAETLWDRDVDLEQKTEEHLTVCYGGNAGRVREYLDTIDPLLSSTAAEPHKGSLSSGDSGKAAELVEVTNRFSRRISRWKATNERERRYLDLLGHFNHLVGARSKAVLARESGGEKGAERALRETGRFLKGTEGKTDRYLDTWIQLRSMS
jgi:hypothetical protein